MTEIMVESTPSGGTVLFDGNDVGTTPVTIVLSGDTTLSEFREAYMDGSSVKCTWATMKTLLEDLVVSRLWWMFSRDERYSIAEMAILNTFKYELHYGREGYPDCAGGTGEFKKVVCVGNAIIRTLKFGKIDYMAGSCYYKQSETSEEYCYRTTDIYGLPCHIVGCGSYEPGFGHAMCSIQIVDSYESIDNWIIFQYNDFDIQLGDLQIPSDRYDLYLRFGELTRCSCSGYSSDELVRFEHI